MKKFLSYLTKYSLIIICATAVLGVLLAVYPDIMLAYAAFFIGGALIICGIVGVINYFVGSSSKFTLALGILSVVAGVIVCVAYRQIISVMIFLLGAFLLVGGIVNLVNSAYVAYSRNRSWILTVIMSVASIVLGIVSLRNPFGTQTGIVRFVGISLIAFAVLDTISYIQLKKAFIEADKRIDNENAENAATEVEFREVDTDTGDTAENE